MKCNRRIVCSLGAGLALRGTRAGELASTIDLSQVGSNPNE